MRLKAPWPGGLSGRLLLLTALFVMLAELLILAPSLAAFQEQWLTDRVERAEIAALIVEAAPDQRISERLSQQLLEGAGVLSISVQAQGVRSLILAAPRLERFPDLVDLRNRGWLTRLSRPWRALFGGGVGRTLRVVAAPRFTGGDFVEIVVPEQPLTAELRAHLAQILGVALFLGVVAGGLVYVTLVFFLVRPIGRITGAMERFRADPNDPAARLKPSGRRDEIGRAEQELDRMQEEIRAALQSRARLAALGVAVAKINHDLRNMLTSAQMASDRMAASPDPQVGQALPRLERALDRAIRLASDVLEYGSSAEPEPQTTSAPLAEAVRAAAEDAGLSPDGVRLESVVDAGATVRADADQLHRILVNLMRNAREAIEHAPLSHGRGRIAVSARRDGGFDVVRLQDNGPGVAGRVRERLFQPFAGSGRPGGAGLGLAIARELAQAHGGDVALSDSGPNGAAFEVRLPV